LFCSATLSAFTSWAREKRHGVTSLSPR
jgi:hypothetical protein